MKIKLLFIALLTFAVATSVVGQRKQEVTGKGKALLMSAVYPGWGGAKLNQQNSLLAIGGVFYLTLGGSYYYHHRAVSNYDKYIVADNIYDRAEYSKDWDTDLKLSKIFFASASAIWVADMIWVATLKSGSTYSTNYKYRKSRLFSYYNPQNNAPMLGLTIQF